MARAKFHVLCRNEDDKEACARIKALMHDCKVSDASPYAAYNHVGEREFPSAAAAVGRMLELKELAGRDVIDISVRVES